MRAVKNRKNPDRVLRRNSFCLFSVVMGSNGGDFTAIETATLKWETIEGLKWAIDNSYRRLRDAARHEWEQRFAGPDPSDACVSVRINSNATEAPGLTLACQLPGQAHPTAKRRNATPSGVTC